MRLKNFPLIACILLSAFHLAAQDRQDAYTAKWKLTDSLIDKKGLTQSALAEVEKIYTLAKSEKNDAQLIKALVYRMNLQANNREDATQKNIKDLEREIASSQEPARSILTSILAGVYQDYFSLNRFKLYSRTNTGGFKEEDIVTWGIGDLDKKIGDLYLASLHNEALLWQTPLLSLAPVIIRGNAGSLRPTLLDLLAHRALDYFKNDEGQLNRPAYTFEIDDPAVFSGLPVFAVHPFHSADSSSLHFQALLLFQRLIRRHLSEGGEAPLVDLDIERVRFVYQYAVMDNKEGFYQKALSGITDLYEQAGKEDAGPGLDEAWYLQAQLFADRAGRYDPSGDTANRYDYLPAKAICEKVIAKNNKSEGNTNCRDLLKRILYKSLLLETESFNIPGKPFLSLLSWRNFSKAWFRLVRMDHNIKEGLGNNSWQDDYWTKLLQVPVIRSFSQSLPATGDYQQHRAEIRTEALPAGEYAMIVSSDSNFRLGPDVVALQYFYVSSIALVNYGNDCFVLNRESGQPLANASVQIWNRRYEYTRSAFINTRAETYQTDQHGHFLLSPHTTGEPGGNMLVEISSPGDHFFPENAFSTPYNTSYSRAAEDGSADDRKTFFFTDRSIYRPGQTVYFKGIAVTRDRGTKQPRILTSFTTKVILYDVNEQKIDSLSLTTNEYGSYHGRFLLPQGLLKGEFNLEDEVTGQRLAFSVEEYKRPSFSIDFEKLKGSHRVGDSIHVEGAARAYAGNPIGGGLVKYLVTRIARFPYTWSYWRTGRPAATTQEIAHGTVLTRADGSFSIGFTALPDRTTRKEQDPVFEYKISADITDINGETRSGETVVQVGDKTLRLAIRLPAQPDLPSDSLRELAVRATDLSGEPEAAAVTITIYKLKDPGRMFRSRYWSAPDQFVMSRGEWVAAFPHDAFGEEAKVESWEREPVPGASVSLRADSLDPGLSIGQLRGPSFLPGWYMIEARATDKYGQEVKDVHYVALYENSTGRPANPQYEWASASSETLEPAATATVTAGSSASGVYMIRKLDAGEGNPRADTGFSFFTLDDSRKRAEFPVTGSDRGGFIVSDIFVKDNRVYPRSHVVYVPWSNKELKISYASFRDKTLPGSAEKWQVHISGNKGDKVAAEVLAGMYDASLDAFRMQNWSAPSLYPALNVRGGWNNTLPNFYSVQSQQRYYNDNIDRRYDKIYDRLLVPRSYQRIMIRGNAAMSYRSTADSSAVGVDADALRSEEKVVIGYGTPHLKIPNTGEPHAPLSDPSTGQAPVQVRKNFAETAFFFPDLRTDSAGDISFSFTIPEALTRWKWMTLAHTKELAFGYSERSVVTSKQLMVQPNAPRFLREGDRMEFSARIVNLTDSELTGQMELQLTDPTTGQSVDGWFSNREANQYFTVGARQSVSVAFSIDIPFQYNRPVSYRIIAKARSYSDGEEATLPVVSNRMLVTESLPLNLPGNGTKNYHFDKLLQSGASETLNHHALTVEFTSNPAWYAVQALPYLMEYPYQCAEQTFNRFYANALAAHMVNSSPRIAQVFEKWKTSDTAALLSNLEKNEDLKSLLLKETPWVLQGKNESQQKKNIALLFDKARVARELGASLAQLQDLQSPNGGFVWFKGGPDDRYITQLILTGLGRLQKLDALPAALSDKIADLVAGALPYLDGKIKEDFANLKKNNKGVTAGTGLNSLQVQYLYMRTFFSERGIPGDVFPAVNYYRKQAQQFWLSSDRYTQGMIALALYRTGDVKTAADIMASLRQNAIRDEEKGMYWKDMQAGYYWYQAPVETQSLLIEAFSEIAPDAAVDRGLRTWLLKQKQTQGWPTTVATADACYALLLGGTDWLAQDRNTLIRIGDKAIGSSSAEAGSGYFKKVFDGAFVNPAMGNITVTMSGAPGGGNAGAPDERSAGKPAGSAKPGQEAKAVARSDGGPAWGAVYWQYFENLDRIVSPEAATAALRLDKKLFIEKITDKGPVLEPVADNGVLHPGDKVKIRIVLRCDRDLEYVHMKDMRAACMEPVNVLSGYKWQGGLGYYESTGDIGTDFFFSRLPRGTWVFEYPVFVGQTGNFSNGVTSIECMYAPEFSFHSEGIRVNVENN